MKVTPALIVSQAGDEARGRANELRPRLRRLTGERGIGGPEDFRRVLRLCLSVNSTRSTLSSPAGSLMIVAGPVERRDHVQPCDAVRSANRLNSGGSVAPSRVTALAARP